MLFRALIAGLFVVSLVASLMVNQAVVADEALESDWSSIDSEIQGIKKAVIDLNRDLSTLKEQSLYPKQDRLLLFFSISAEHVPQKNNPYALNIMLDKQVIVQQSYSPAMYKALLKGGIQRLFVGSLPEGKHTLTVNIEGASAAKFVFDKQSKEKNIELRLETKGGTSKLTFKEWS